MERISQALDYRKADIVLSDAVPDFVGEPFVDHISACNLNYVVLNSMKKLLRTGGVALVKVMNGPSIDEVIDAYLVNFSNCSR